MLPLISLVVFPVLLSFSWVSISHIGIRSDSTLFYVTELFISHRFASGENRSIGHCVFMCAGVDVTVLMRTTGAEKCPFLTLLLKQMFS